MIEDQNYHLVNNHLKKEIIKMTSYIIIRKNKEENKRKNNKEEKNLFKDIKNKINKKLVMTLRYGMIFFLKINLNKNH